MHGHPNVKFAIAKQAKETLPYKNIKRKLHRTTAAIWYNKICRSKHLTPNNTAIRINGNKRQNRNTIKAATRYRINQEIKFLYIKKQTKRATIPQAPRMRGTLAQQLANNTGLNRSQSTSGN
jgi:hypothetical protein